MPIDRTWNARVVQVIKTDLLRRGKGTEDDPMRLITQYWTLQGELLWEFDAGKANTGRETSERANRFTTGRPAGGFTGTREKEGKDAK